MIFSFRVASPFKFIILGQQDARIKTEFLELESWIEWCFQRATQLCTPTTVTLKIRSRSPNFHLVLMMIIWLVFPPVVGGAQMGPVKRICVFEHSVKTNFNCACPAIQKGQGSGFLSECSSSLTACMSEQQRFWQDCADVQARLNLRCSHRL